MLTFILLVVIGGGAGLWVVSMAESTKPATDGSGSSRGADDGPDAIEDDPDVEGHTEVEDEAAVEDHTEIDAEIEVDPVAAPVHETIPGYVPVPAAATDEPDDVEPAPADARRALRQERAQPGGKVSKAYTAVEGRYADVAHVPLWRRLLSLLGIITILAVLGVGIAAVLGAAFAAVAEIFTNTIG